MAGANWKIKVAKIIKTRQLGLVQLENNPVDCKARNKLLALMLIDKGSI